jgi:hypothetical protein
MVQKKRDNQMADSIEELERKVDAIMGALFQLAHDLKNGPGSDKGFEHIQNAGSTLSATLLALTDDHSTDVAIATEV